MKLKTKVKVVNENQVISLTKWKKEKVESKQEVESLKRYLSVLSFYQIIQETHQMIAEIRKGELTRYKVLKSKLVLQEFKNRLLTENANKQLNFMCKKISQKLEAIEGYI